MNLKTDLVDPKLWASVTAIIVSVLAYLRSGKALRLQFDQEARKKPRMSIDWENGFIRTLPVARIYAFNVTIRNLSDSGNAVVRSFLTLKCRENTSLVTPAEFTALPTPPEDVADTARSALSLPAKIGTREAMQGWIYFTIPLDILDHLHILGYRVHVEDTTGIRYHTDAVILMEED